MNSYQIVKKIDKKQINNILQDMIEIRNNELNIDLFRNKLISNRLSKINHSNILTASVIDRLTRDLKSGKSEYALGKSLKSVHKVISNYYKQLLHIYNELR